VRIDLALDPDPTFTVDEVRETVGPLGETESVRFTFPEKLLTLATVIVTVPEFPETRLREPMFGEIVKSGPTTVTITVVLRWTVALLPVTVTL